MGLFRQPSLRVTYRAKTRHLDRDICPHSIIFASNRYHVRAYCHLSGHFLGLVISRIDNFRASQEPWVPSTEDGEWNGYADIVFTVNHSLPRLSVVANRMDYGFKESENLTVTCRKALAFYVSMTSRYAGQSGKRHSSAFVIVEFVLATLAGRPNAFRHSPLHRQPCGLAGQADAGQGGQSRSLAHLTRLLNRLDWLVLNRLIN